MRPTLTSDVFGETFLSSGTVNLHGGSMAEQYALFQYIKFHFDALILLNSQKKNLNLLFDTAFKLIHEQMHKSVILWLWTNWLHSDDNQPDSKF